MAKRATAHGAASPGAQTRGGKPTQDSGTDTPVAGIKRKPVERVSSARFESAERELRQLFGHNVREARLRAGLTQADVGAIIDSDQPYVGAVERGEQNVTLAIVTRLAFAVRTDPGALLLGEAAENYSLETVIRIVSALRTYLQGAMDKQGPDNFKSDMLTIIPKVPAPLPTDRTDRSRAKK